MSGLLPHIRSGSASRSRTMPLNRLCIVITCTSVLVMPASCHRDGPTKSQEDRTLTLSAKDDIKDTQESFAETKEAQRDLFDANNNVDSAMEAMTENSLALAQEDLSGAPSTKKSEKPQVQGQALTTATEPPPSPLKPSGDAKNFSPEGALFQAGDRAAEAHQIEQAKQYFLSSCQGGNIAACHRYGWYLQLGGNLENAIRFYKRGCSVGLGKSCNNIGSIYETRQDWEKARDYYSWSCIHKHQTGCSNLQRIRHAQYSLQNIPLKKKDNVPLFVH